MNVIEALNDNLCYLLFVLLSYSVCYHHMYTCVFVFSFGFLEPDSAGLQMIHLSSICVQRNILVRICIFNIHVSYQIHLYDPFLKMSSNLFYYYGIH